MRLDPWALARMTCLSVVLGVALSVFLELMRFVWSLFGVGVDSRSRGRGRAAAQGIALFFRDVIFFTVAGVSFSVLVYSTNNGRVRLSAVLGVLAGLWLGYLTVGRLMRCACGAVSCVLREVAVTVATAVVGAFRAPAGHIRAMMSEKRKKLKGRKKGGSDVGAKDTKDQ